MAIVDCDIDIKYKEVEGRKDKNIYAGAIVGKSDYNYCGGENVNYNDWTILSSGISEITNCYTTGKIKVSTSSDKYSAFACGIIGDGCCNIEKCYSNANLIGKGELSEVYAIGSIGYLMSSVFERTKCCYFSGNLECDNKFFGKYLEDCYYLNTCYTTENLMVLNHLLRLR